ncbi:unnamed protein product [Arabis nemorensis]|uniref:Uncharacterized protein n=1 Tax=Arabis nemorensis TaxID=586526 RepID=A0A565AYE8_9BRAS|nr:unnamed protein product [Arabis nemorensis]
MAENFTNFVRLRGNNIAGFGLVLRDSTQLDSSVTSESYLTSVTQGTITVIGGVSHTFAVLILGQKSKEVAVCEIAGTSSTGVCKAETKLIHIQPLTETEITDDRTKSRKKP